MTARSTARAKPSTGALPDPLDLSGPNDVDLDRHAVIEASAGTGKTYTIEHLVRRLIGEKGIPLDQILLVTFTEKAAGELKDRVRAAVEGAIAAGGTAHADLLRRALDAFDEAPVFTIHGFCQRVLREYAFENRLPFRLEVVDDKELCARRLREVQRRTWQERYGEDLLEILELSGYPGDIDGEACSWEQLATRLATSYRRRCGDEFRPPPMPDLRRAVADAQHASRDALAALAKLLGPTADRVEGHPFYARFEKLNIYSQQKGELRSRLVLPLLRMLASTKHEPDKARQPSAFCRVVRLFAQCGSGIVDGGFDAFINPAWKTRPAPNSEACPELAAVGRLLQTLWQRLNWTGLRHQLLLETVTLLQAEMTRFKDEHGQVSFDDMLCRVDDALNPRMNPAATDLLAALRGRFRYALVDEFQDTDPVQWSVFRRIFVEGTSDHRLMIIGDPKQAIYAFRGADVHTYLAARAALCGAPASGNAAGYYSLPTNWRSHPDLIVALNCVFGDGGWFAGAPGASGAQAPITYRTVKPPDDCRARVYHDETGRTPLTLVDLPEATAGGMAQLQFARFIAAEVERLLSRGPDGAPRLVFDRRGRPEALHAGHVCVLVRSRRESRSVENALREKRIPFAFYKKPGLWQSEEATHLSYLLRAIAEPEDFGAFRRALLTRFFHVPREDAYRLPYGPIPLAQLGRYEDLAPSHPLRLLLAGWRDWAQRRQWPRLFDSILHETGVLLDEAREPDGRRRIANHRHLLQVLLETAVARNLDVTGLVELVDRLRADSAAGAADDEDLHRLESEEPAVQIITIHKAKGLEFPVVFLAGGFTRGGSNPYYRFHGDDGNVVHDLTMDPANEPRNDAEEADEHRRLFYVALTRAMYKLYVPRFGETKGKPGPVVTLLHAALTAARPDDRCPGACRSVAFDGKRTTDVSGAKPWKPKLDRPPKGVTPSPTARPAEAAPQLLFPASDPAFRDAGARLMSFTSLAAGTTAVAPADAVDKRAFGDRDARPGEEEAESPPTTGTAARVDVMPYGNVTGDLLHQVLEGVNFATLADADQPERLLDDPHTRGLFDREIRDHYPAVAAGDAGVCDAYRREIADMAWRTLRTPLPAAGGPLCEVTASDRLHELQFYYPLEGVGPAAGRDPGIEAVRVCRGDYVFGVIDLVFRREGRYFLADFKSNVIDEGYGPDAIRANMAHHRYDLQYQLYTLALVRWLRQVHGDEFEFGRHFGGVYYLYLRGMDGGSADGPGVFYHLPTSDEVRGYELRIARMIGKAGSW